MNLLEAEAPPAGDQKAIDELRPIVVNLSPAGRRKLLSILARDCLAEGVPDVPLVNDDGEVFAFLSSTNAPILDLASRFTPEELAEIERNLLDPKQHMTLQETLALLASDDDRTDRS